MAISIKDLVKDLLKEQILESLLEIAKTAKLSTTAWQPGEPLYGFLSIFTEQLAGLWNDVIVPAIRAGFLDYAEGDWLTLKAWTDYFTFRKDSKFATGDIVIENRGGGVYTFFPGDLRVKTKPTALNPNKTYTNITGGSLGSYSGSGPYPNIPIQFRADEAGTGSNAAIGDIQGDAVQGFAGVYVQTNTVAIFGDDGESDELLIERCRLFAATLSPAGAKDAYRYLARSARRADGTAIDVTRVAVINPSLAVLVIYLAGLNGATPGDMGTVGSDVYVARMEMEKALPAGISMTALSATEVTITDTVTLSVDRGANVTEAEAIQAAMDAIDLYFQTLPIGGHKLLEGDPGRVIPSEYRAQASESIKGIMKVTSLLGDIILGVDEVAVPDITVLAELVTQ